MKKMILVILLLFVVNCNLIYGKQNYENTLWRDLQQKRENSIEKITEITGAKIKAVYFDSRCDDFDDKDIWQDGLLYIKINLAEKVLKEFIENDIKNSWKNISSSDNGGDNQKSMLEDIESTYLHNISQNVKVRDKDGSINRGIAETVHERIDIKKENSNESNLIYRGAFERKNYEFIINLFINQNKIRINSKEYLLNSPIYLKNGTTYIPKDATEKILTALNKDKEEYMKKFYGNGMILIDGKLYFPYRRIIEFLEDTSSDIFYDTDLKMVSSISINLDEMKRTDYGYFE